MNLSGFVTGDWLIVGGDVLYTIGQMIAKFSELKTEAERIAEEHEKELKPYQDGMKTIQGAILLELQTQNLQNFKSDKGTAYQSTTMSVKVDNRDEFLNFITSKGYWSMASIGAYADPVKDYLDTHNGVPPPGLTITSFTKCNIRRS